MKVKLKIEILANNRTDMVPALCSLAKDFALNPTMPGPGKEMHRDGGYALHWSVAKADDDDLLGFYERFDLTTEQSKGD